jgi:molybdopterin converting factor small subunit
MKVTVRLFATFRELYPTQAGGGPLAIEASEHESVHGLLTALHLPEEMPRIILVNGQLVAEGRILQEGDVVSIFPPLIGGKLEMDVPPPGTCTCRPVMRRKPEDAWRER